MSALQKLLPLVLLSVVTCVHASEIRDTQDELIAWVDAEKVISETKADWMAEKEIVTDLIKLLEVEKEKYVTNIEKLEDSSDATDQMRTELNADKERLVAATEALESYIPSLEAKVKALLMKLPKPLLEELDPLSRRLPEDATASRLPVSQRLLTVVGILNKVDKFNTGITIKSEIRSVGGSSSEVTTLYFGLAGAYFSNESGSYAGTGAPGSDGWEWTENQDKSDQILALIKSYSGAREAKFVELPVSVR